MLLAQGVRGMTHISRSYPRESSRQSSSLPLRRPQERLSKMVLQSSFLGEKVQTSKIGKLGVQVFDFPRGGHLILAIAMHFAKQ